MLHTVSAYVDRNNTCKLGGMYIFGVCAMLGGLSTS